MYKLQIKYKIAEKSALFICFYLAKYIENNFKLRHSLKHLSNTY